MCVAVIAAGVINFIMTFLADNLFNIPFLGLVFPTSVGSSTVYFLKGIVSTGGNKGGSCDNDKYTLFTNVQYYIPWLQYLETQNRPK